MSFVLVTSIAVRLLALGWSIALTFRLRDWRMAFLASMLALMAARQALTLRVVEHSRDLSVAGGASEVPGLAVSVMAFLAIVFLARMLNDRKRKETALRAAYDFNRRIADIMPDLLCVYDLESGRVVYANRGIEKVVGYTAEEMATIPVVPRIHPDDKAALEEALRRLANARDGEVVRLELRARHANGEWRWVDASGAVFSRKADGTIERLLGVARDITERRRTEEALHHSQKVEAMGTLAGGIAHDFNNILSVFLGNVQLAQANLWPDSPEHQNLDEALRAGERAKTLVDQILAFTRRRVPEQRRVALHSVVEETLRFMRASLPATVQIRKRLATEGDLVVVDPTQIHQVVTNLCVNAGQAMQDCGGTLEVSLEPVEIDRDATLDLETGSYVRLTVKDTGSGIASDIVDRIFEPFFTTKSPGQGTGMGLAVVDRIVRDHGGRVLIEHTGPGDGAIFVVYLPRADGRLEADRDLPRPLPRGSERVLFVDDEAAIVSVGRQMLESLGYEVVACTNGVEALETFRAAPGAFALVVTDATMPAMTGADLSRELLRIRPDIPVILCTGFSEKTTPEQASDMGIRAYLQKPILIENLAASVRDALGGTRAITG